MQREIQNAAFIYQREIETKDRIIVGVNEFISGDTPPGDILKVNPAIERKQKERLARIHAERNAEAARKTLAHVEEVTRDGANLMPPIIAAVCAYATLGENLRRNAPRLRRIPPLERSLGGIEKLQKIVATRHSRLLSRGFCRDVRIRFHARSHDGFTMDKPLHHQADNLGLRLFIASTVRSDRFEFYACRGGTVIELIKHFATVAFRSGTRQSPRMPSSASRAINSACDVRHRRSWPHPCPCQNRRFPGRTSIVRRASGGAPSFGIAIIRVGPGHVASQCESAGKSCSKWHRRANEMRGATTNTGKPMLTRCSA